MKTSKKTSDASVRVLETLKILSKTGASIQDIINHLEKLDPNNRIYTNEVILKYINTLKVFGFRFIKEKDKYVLLNVPEQLEFNEDDLRAINLIQNFFELLPEENIKMEINKFLQELQKRFSDNTKLLSSRITKPINMNFNFDYNKYLDQIKEYEKYCLEKQRLKITYKQQKNIKISNMVEPNEIKYKGNELYLSVYNPISAQVQDINFSAILKIEQLPLKSNGISILSSATFQLKDRLAKVYKLHEGEKLLQIKADGSIIILNQTEDRILLLKRLMRYGEYCEVISPKSLKREMKELIKSTLANYC
mgnify:CR=1 FL=1